MPLKKGEFLESPTQFKKGKSGNPNGRPKKLLSQLGDIGYNKAQIRATFDALMAMTYEEILKVATHQGSEYTILEITLAAAMAKDLANGQTWTLGRLMEWAIGKPTEQVEQTVTNVNPQIIIQPVATSVPLSDKQIDG